MSARTADNESADAGVAVTANPPTAARVATAARVRDRGRCESRGRHATGWPVSFFRRPPTGLAVGFGRGRGFALRRRGAAPIHPKGNVWVPGSIAGLGGPVRRTTPVAGCHGTVTRKVAVAAPAGQGPWGRRAANVRNDSAGRRGWPQDAEGPGRRARPGP